MSLSSQELPAFFPELIRAGVKLNACSLHQLEAYGAAFPGGEVGLRFNPGLGSGGTGKTNVGGPDSSFGIWHELLPQAQAIVAKHKLKARSRRGCAAAACAQLTLHAQRRLCASTRTSAPARTPRCGSASAASPSTSAASSPTSQRSTWAAAIRSAACHTRRRVTSSFCGCACLMRAESAMTCAAQGTELAVIGAPVKDAFVAFSTETGRKVRTRRCANSV